MPLVKLLILGSMYAYDTSNIGCLIESIIRLPNQRLYRETSRLPERSNSSGSGGHGRSRSRTSPACASLAAAAADPGGSGGAWPAKWQRRTEEEGCCTGASGWRGGGCQGEGGEDGGAVGVEHWAIAATSWRKLCWCPWLVALRGSSVPVLGLDLGRRDPPVASIGCIWGCCSCALHGLVAALIFSYRSAVQNGGS
jgi:hypothetical protein